MDRMSSAWRRPTLFKISTPSYFLLATFTYMFLERQPILMPAVGLFDQLKTCLVVFVYLTKTPTNVILFLINSVIRLWCYNAAHEPAAIISIFWTARRKPANLRLGIILPAAKMGEYFKLKFISRHGSIHADHRTADIDAWLVTPFWNIRNVELH